MRKWQCRLPAVVAMLGGFWGSLALAENAPSATAVAYPQPATSHSLARNSDHVRTALYREQEQQMSFGEEPSVAPTPDDVEKLARDEPPAPLPAADFEDAETPAAYAGYESYDTARGYATDGCGGQDDTSCRPPHRPDMEHALPIGGGTCGGRSSGRGGVLIGGWIDQGITVNGQLPADRFNGPVTFNDRDGEYQLNQLWLYAEKAVDTVGYGWDIGGRVDFVYGTDWRFTSALGLEDKWNSQRFYGAALPQLYMDVAVDDFMVRMGHFYTIIGYEVTQAPDNFFYSHAYAMQYGEPLSHTGLLATYALSDRLTVSAGFDRGWDNWEDNNHDLSFLGGVSWTSCDEATSLAFAISSGHYDAAGENNRAIYSVVFTHQLTDRLQYVLQHDWGEDEGGGFQVQAGPIPDAEWYGINQYLIWELNECWGLGLRFEWFRDDDGTRVGGLGAPHGWTLGPDRDTNQRGWAGDFYAITFALNWKPSHRINVRPEVRWDWYEGPVDGAGRLPYDFGFRSEQFTFGTDLIITF